MTVLVIGGSGFIGSSIVKALTDSNVETICYDLIHTDSAGSKNHWIRADILELQSIERIFFEYKIDAIIHLVGLPAIDYCQKDPHFSFLLNVMSVQNTLEAMRLADIPKIVFASSATVYGNHSDSALSENAPTAPATVYGYHKLVAEHAIRSYSDNYGIKSTNLRLFNVYGGNPKLGKEVISIMINRALQNMPLLVKGPDKFRDFVHIDDVAESFVKAISSNHSDAVTVNIGTGTKTTIREVASIVSSHFPNLKVIEEESPDNGTGLWANVAHAKEVLGFAGRTPKEGIDTHVAKYSSPKAVEFVTQN